MGSALVYVVVVGLVAGAVYLVAALVFGRGEELAPMPPSATPTRLPARDLTGGDVRDLRFQQTVRGYKCSEVDWALERLAAEVDALRSRLEVVTAAHPDDVTRQSAPPAPPAPADDPTGPTNAVAFPRASGQESRAPEPGMEHDDTGVHHR